MFLSQFYFILVHRWECLIATFVRRDRSANRYRDRRLHLGWVRNELSVPSSSRTVLAERIRFYGSLVETRLSIIAKSLEIERGWLSKPLVLKWSPFSYAASPDVAWIYLLFLQIFFFGFFDHANFCLAEIEAERSTEFCHFPCSMYR